MLIVHRFDSLNFPYLNFHNLLIEYNGQIDVCMCLSRGFLMAVRRVSERDTLSNVCEQYQSGNIQVPSICCITELLSENSQLLSIRIPQASSWSSLIGLYVGPAAPQSAAHIVQIY